MNAKEIAAELRQKIASGELPHGSKLPSVRELAKTHETSQQTGAAAYAVLDALGLVRTDRSGTVVIAGPSADAHLGTFSPPDLTAAAPWSPTNGGAGSEETTQVRQISAPAYMAEWGIPEGTAIVERTRIRSVDGVPAQHKLTIMPYETASMSPEGHEGIPPMLAPVGAPPLKPPRGMSFADWVGWDVVGTQCFIEVEQMDAMTAAALGMSDGAPGFRVAAVAKDSSDATVFVTVTTAPLHHRLTMDVVH